MEAKLRAFQLDSAGSLFSFYKTGVYTLIEARIPKGGIDLLIADLKIHAKEKIDVLHITSWDIDHCKYDDLIQIMNQLRPSVIEFPSYIPDTDNGNLCLNNIQGYKEIHKDYTPTLRVISPEYIGTLTAAPSGGTNNVVYSSKFDDTKKNDMSLIKLFRSFGFNVFSLGDCECSTIADSILASDIAKNEVDVLILPHHGADNGFITEEFLKSVNPKIAVSTSNYGNQYEHPKQAIRDLLYKMEIPLYTTKTGDVWVVHKKGKTESEVYNMMSDNSKISSESSFVPKRHHV